MNIHSFKRIKLALLISTILPGYCFAQEINPKAFSSSQPVGPISKFNLDAQPDSFLELLPTLIESDATRDARLGPMKRPAEAEIPSPPTIREYLVKDLQVDGVSTLAARFVRDFELAKMNDPAYQAALYEYQVGDINADVVALAYTPRLSVQNAFLQNENNSRTTVSVSQPLFNMQLLATVKEEDSRRAAAQAQMQIREYELSERLFEAVVRLIESQEQLTVNTARMEALQNEFVGAKRELELGVGAVTDVRDAETRLDQARAEQLKFKAAIKTATRRLFQLTGEKPDPANYALSRTDRVSPVKPSDFYMARALDFNSDLLKSRAEERLIELAALKSKSAYLPYVDLTVSRSYSNSGDTQNSGVTFGVSVPINAGTFYEASAATARLSQARLSTREILEKVESSVEQSHFNVVVGLEEVRARLQAIESAKLSVTANEKSFTGGVRTRLDVLNSVETLYVVNQQYIQSVIELARNYLKLSNQAALPVKDTVSQIHQILF
jgi:protease secretion system outer membrane protein